MYSCGTPHMANQKQDDQLEHTYNSFVMIRDVTLKTCKRRWMIGRRGERGSEISVLATGHDDDDDESISQNLEYLVSIQESFFHCKFFGWNSFNIYFQSACYLNKLSKYLLYIQRQVERSEEEYKTKTALLKLISITNGIKHIFKHCNVYTHQGKYI